MIERISEITAPRKKDFSGTLELAEFFLNEIEHFNLAQQSEIQRTLLLMFELHLDQEDRPDGKPYANHPLQVALNLLKIEPNASVEQVQAALLHDSVEDQPRKLSKFNGNGFISYEELSRMAVFRLQHEFNEKVADLVYHLTNPDFNKILLKEGHRKTDIQFNSLKNKLYAEHVQRIIEIREILPIKLADFSENAFNVATNSGKKQLTESKKTYLKSRYLPIFPIIRQRLVRDNLYPEFQERLKREYFRLRNS